MIERSELKKFNREDYYKTGNDLSYKEEEKGFYVELYPEGRELINNHYSSKYNTNIAFLTHSDDIGDDKDIAFARDKKIENYRKAFIIGDTHSELIVYLKEKNKECILYADSINICGNAYALQLYDLMKIPLYIVDDIRQRDLYSCHTDALVMARDITAKDMKSEDYQYKNLFSKIETRSKNKSKLLLANENKKYVDAPIFDAILPNVLLKTSQRSEFVLKHYEKNHEKIHKTESITKFLRRHTERLKIMSEKENSHSFESRKVKRYLLLKGRKYADIIEIQFYLEQLKEIFSENWDKSRSLEFIKIAKIQLRSQGPIDTRDGLHAFVQKYIDDFQEKLNKQGQLNPLKL